MPIHKKNTIPPLTVHMSDSLKSYYRNKAQVKDEGKKTREDNQNEFLFDNKLHEEMQNAVLGYNPYQE